MCACKHPTCRFSDQRHEHLKHASSQQLTGYMQHWQGLDHDLLACIAAPLTSFSGVDQADAGMHQGDDR